MVLNGISSERDSKRDLEDLKSDVSCIHKNFESKGKLLTEVLSISRKVFHVFNVFNETNVFSFAFHTPSGNENVLRKHIKFY